jgi:penicillin amidase/acyl-homoserine-lactone acylase
VKQRAILALGLAAFAASCAKPAQAPSAPERPYDVRILRDTYGVPHVFGRTDADTAFGLAYAHAEDDFATIQETLFAIRGRLASVKGPKAAPGDYVVALLGIWGDVERGWSTQIDERTRALLEGYAAGINRYASLHPREVWDGLVPVRGQDVLAGFALRAPFFFGLDQTLRRLFETGGAEAEAKQVAELPFAAPSIGSNTIAVGPRRSADHVARLWVNSHQPWSGPVAWYEAHVHSDEGWDAVGGVFPGAPLVLHGHNRDLGWAFTVNRPDLADVYRLEINPANENQYRFDGTWRDLEISDAPLRVRLFGFLPWTVHRPVLRSIHGPVLRLPHGTFALRWSGMGEIRQVEQWYRMNRARDFAEWKDAMRMQAIASLNAAYADRTGRIYYLYNAKLPIRAPGFDWSGTVPGDTSATLWTAYRPFDALPQVENPPSGFVQNCNSSPFHTTIGAGNPSPADFAPSDGIETRMTNRSLRALEQLAADRSITADALRAIKFDVGYSEESDDWRYFQRAIAAAAADPTPLEARAIALARSWDRRATAENRAAPIALLTIYPWLHAHGGAEPDPRASLDAAATGLERRFGRLDPTWAEVNRMQRGATDLGVDGGPDVLHAVEGPTVDGRIEADSGDGLMLLVAFDRKGVHSESLHQYGSASTRPASPHYADQMELFATHRTKPVWLDLADIRAHLEREYRPGEELR